MVETAGNKLRRARQLRHLSLEDAARTTKIREHQLADLEGDDYSNFANLAYARSYLVNYGKYLRVDVRPYLEAFSDASTFGLDDYQYLSETPVGMYRIPYRRRTRARRVQRGQLIGGAVALALLTMAIFGWFVAVNIQRLGDPNKLAARLEARERAAREGTTEGITANPAATANTAPAAVPAPADNPAANGQAAKVAAPGNELVPVAAPASAPTADTPAPSLTPVPVPVDAPTQNTIPALAATTEPAAVERPSLPLPGDGHAVREMLTAHNNAQPHPQKVANDRPRGQ